MVGNTVQRWDNSKRNIFLETGFHLFHSVGKGFTLDEMVKEVAKYYRVESDTKRVVIEDQYHEKIINSKQLSLLTDQWKLIAQEDGFNKWKIDLFDFEDKYSAENLNDQYPQAVKELVPLLEEHFKVVMKLD